MDDETLRRMRNQFGGIILKIEIERGSERREGQSEKIWKSRNQISKSGSGKAFQIDGKTSTAPNFMMIFSNHKQISTIHTYTPTSPPTIMVFKIQT